MEKLLEIENENYDKTIISEWVGDAKIVAMHEGQNNLIIITEFDKLYTMYRFFIGRNKTVCSIDAQDKDIPTLLARLLEVRDI
jgi:hypothetical protein